MNIVNTTFKDNGFHLYVKRYIEEVYNYICTEKNRLVEVSKKQLLSINVDKEFGSIYVSYTIYPVIEEIKSFDGVEIPIYTKLDCRCVDYSLLINNTFDNT